MYYKGQIAGLSPDTRYRVAFAIEPGRVDEGGLWRMNVDKGQQTNGGDDANHFARKA